MQSSLCRRCSIAYIHGRPVSSSITYLSRVAQLRQQQHSAVGSVLFDFVTAAVTVTVKRATTDGQRITSARRDENIAFHRHLLSVVVI